MDPLAYYSPMRSHRRIAGVLLAAVLVVITFLPFWEPLRFPRFLGLIVVASILGGVIIGRRSAVYIAAGTMIGVGVFWELTIDIFFRFHSYEYLRIAVLSAGYAALAGCAAAFGMWLSRRPSIPTGIGHRSRLVR